MRGSLLVAVVACCLTTPVIAQVGTCHWSGDLQMTSQVRLKCDQLEIDDEAVITTNGYSLEVETRLLLIHNEATIRSYPPVRFPFEPPKLHPPRADPNWDPGPDSTAPAVETGDGRNGGSSLVQRASGGRDGARGRNAGPIVIRVTEKASGALRVLNQGEKGASSTSGEHGIGGGNGQQGGRSRTGTIGTPFGDICYCDAGGGSGGRGGNGGDGGDAGTPGAGGDSASVQIDVRGDYSEFVVIRVDVRSGRPGESGIPGDAGPAGEAGYGGRGSCGCSGVIYSRMGQRGKAGTRGLHKGDKMIPTGTPGTFSPPTALSTYVRNFIDTDPRTSCSQTDGDATQFWSLILKQVKTCSTTRQIGNAIVCTVRPATDTLVRLLRYTDHLSAKTPSQRPFAAPCSASTTFSQLTCIGDALSRDQRIPASEIVKLPHRGSEYLPREETRSLVRFLFGTETAHILADHAQHGPLSDAASVFSRKQLVIEWIKPGSTSTLLLPIDELTMEALAYLSEKYVEWLTDNGAPQALFVSQTNVRFGPSGADLSGERFQNVFDMSSTRFNSRLEKTEFLQTMRMVMIGEGQAVIFPPYMSRPSDDSVAFCNWLAHQGHDLDDGMLSLLRFDGFGKGTTEAILTARGSLSGRVPSLLFSNLLFVLGAWRTTQ